MPPEAEISKTTMILERLIVGHYVSYAMTWTNLKKKMTDKFCPRGEIKKLKVEMWNLKVKGTDVVSYNQCFQELALMCARMFPEELDKIESRVGACGYESLRQLETGTFTSIFKYPTLKQSAIKWRDEYGFVIRLFLAGVTFESMRIDL
nr:reverse transcriptase domain-containing protein [Tanacetum cinerariifolium]